MLKIAGYVVMLGHLFLASTASACAQALGGYVPGFQRNVWRFLAQLLSVAPVVMIMKLNVRVERQAIPYLIVDCMVFPVINWTYFGADAYLPTSSIGCTHATVTILLSVVVSAIVFKEFEWYMSAAVVLCITGVVLVTQPQFIFTSVEPVNIHPLCGMGKDVQGSVAETGHGITTNFAAIANETVNEKYNSVTIIWNSTDTVTVHVGEHGRFGHLALGYAFVVTSAACHVIFLYSTNKGLSEIHPCVIVFWTALSGVTVSLLGMAVFETPMMPSNSLCLGMLPAHATAASICLVLLTTGISLLPARVCALLSSIEVAFMCTAQYTVLKNINNGHGNFLEIMGVVIVVAGNTIRPIHDLYEGYIRTKNPTTEDTE